MYRFLWIFFFFPFGAYPQSWLANGDFEDENICTEFKMNCAPEAWVYTVPSFTYYFKDATRAYSGSHYISLIAGHANKRFYRTYVRSRLLCALYKGHNYRLQLFVKSVHPVIDSMGIYFTPYDFLFEKKQYRQLRPAVYFTDAIKKPVRNDTGWQKIEIDYQATGDEAFIAIGYFGKASISGSTHIPLENNYFVLLDNVTLIPIDVHEKLCSNWAVAKEEIYSQDERHDFLSRIIKEGQNQPYETIRLSPGIMQKIDTFLLPNVYFVTNSYQLDNQTTKLLHSFTASVQKKQMDSLVVEGHTDNTGTEEANLELSQNRARAVADFLQQKLHTAIVSRGWSSSRPVADNQTKEGRQKNRRVEIYVYAKE